MPLTFYTLVHIFKFLPIRETLICESLSPLCNEAAHYSYRIHRNCLTIHSKMVHWTIVHWLFDNNLSFITKSTTPQPERNRRMNWYHEMIKRVGPYVKNLTVELEGFSVIECHQLADMIYEHFTALEQCSFSGPSCVSRRFFMKGKPSKLSFTNVPWNVTHDERSFLISLGKSFNFVLMFLLSASFFSIHIYPEFCYGLLIYYYLDFKFTGCEQVLSKRSLSIFVWFIAKLCFPRILYVTFIYLVCLCYFHDKDRNTGVTVYTLNKLCSYWGILKSTLDYFIELINDIFL